MVLYNVGFYNSKYKYCYRVISLFFGFFIDFYFIIILKIFYLLVDGKSFENNFY